MDWPGLTILLLAGLALSWGGAVAHLAWSLTHPPRRTYAHALRRGWPGTPAEIPAVAGGPREFSEWTFTSRGLVLPVWDLRGDDPAGPVFILTHGWGQSRISGLLRAAALAPLASRLILWDLPGHGESPRASRCALGVREPLDLLALIETLTGAPPRTAAPAPPAAGSASVRIVLHGFSLGANIALAAAAALGDAPRLAAVIAEAPYRLPQTPARRVMRSRGLPHGVTLAAALALLGLWLRVRRFQRSGGGFDRARHAAAVKVPLLVVHPELDAISPPVDGRAIAAAAPRGRFVSIPGAGHTDAWTQEPARHHAFAAVSAFLRPPAPGAPAPAGAAAAGASSADR